MKEYTIGVYFPYERLLHPDKGPALLSELSSLLKKATFEVIADEDIPCLWYKSVKNKRYYQYDDYLPGYTRDQKDFIVRELEQLISDNADDTALVDLLREYITEIQEVTETDVGWANKTAV